MGQDIQKPVEGVLTTIHPPLKTIEIKLYDITDEEYAALLSVSKVRVIPVKD